jgi:multiple sugar transport system substrate-binding protein
VRNYPVKRPPVGQAFQPALPTGRLESLPHGWGLLALLLAVAVLCLPGCARSEAGDAGRVTIRYMAWGNPEQLAVERQIAAEFEKRHPGIHVHLFMVPGSAYSDKLQLMLASRTAPDVVRADHYYFPALVRKEYFRSLEPFIAREPAGFLADFIPLALEEGRWRGELYGLNVLFGAMLIYYNQDLFRQAGLPDPYQLDRQGKWDWAAFVRAAQAITRRDDAGRPLQFGTNVVSSNQSANFQLFASVIWNHGGDYMDSAMTRLTCGADPGAARGLQEYADLRWKYRCAPTPGDSALSAFSFESGKLGMHWGWAGESPRFRRNIKQFRWDIVPTPAGPAGNRTVVKGNQLVIYRETRHPREAWEFVKFMTGPEAELLLCGQLRRAVPTRFSVQRDPRYLKTDQPPFHTDVFLESVRRGHTLPIDHRYQEWQQAFNAGLDPLINVGGGDSRQALAAAAAAANQVLSGEEGF